MDPKTGLPSVICANEQLWSTPRRMIADDWESVKVDLTTSSHQTDYKFEHRSCICSVFAVETKRSCTEIKRGPSGGSAVTCENQGVWTSVNDKTYHQSKWKMVHVTLDNQLEKFDYKVPVKRDNIIKISFNVFTNLSCLSVQRGFDDTLAVTCENKRLWKSQYTNVNGTDNKDGQPFNIWKKVFVQLNNSANSDYKIFILDKPHPDFFSVSTPLNCDRKLVIELDVNFRTSCTAVSREVENEFSVNCVNKRLWISDTQIVNRNKWNSIAIQLDDTSSDYKVCLFVVIK
ncbi:unnamed protein product [Schistosoma mattheei]|uniref:Uncharacterized protein n=1 Tax=Schistosoma mattheei TaxID=31246 RepID=A0A3P8BZG0_9TREM|nr:unnamed protein product [Schistosoma mattheei]